MVRCDVTVMMMRKICSRVSNLGRSAKDNQENTQGVLCNLTCTEDVSHDSKAKGTDAGAYDLHAAVET